MEETVSDTRLDRQLRFVLETDRLNSVERQNILADGSRRENSAEHSWHLAMMAVLLEEHAPEGVALERVLRLVLVHDLVEIDAGDTFAFDATANLDKAEREQRAAERVFGLLPERQASELRSLWEEFEGVSTPEARFANAMDRLQPFLQNSCTQGGTWRIHNVSRAQVLKRQDPVRQYLPKIWPRVVEFVEKACANGWLRRE